MYENRDIQSQHYRRTRFARERIKISESVAETLADASSQEEWFSDEQEDSTGDSSPANIALVPPRLSLQSKELSSVRPATFVQSVTAQLAAQQATSKVTEGSTKAHHTNMLARLAQRFTSSLAAFGAVIQPDVPALLPPSPKNHEVLVSERHPVNIASMYATKPLDALQTSPATVINAIPATPSMVTPYPVQSKQRLAGHTSKIRLQTAQIPKATPQPKEKQLEEKQLYGWSRESSKPIQEPLREPLTVNVRLREKGQEALSGIIHYEEIQVLRTPTTGKSSLINGGMRCTSNFGGGVFETGQSEVMVRNKQAAVSSVVHITLTSNPGPTLLQYVSLHPEVGFTLHLTAPVATKTTFNYVLLTETSL